MAMCSLNMQAMTLDECEHEVGMAKTIRPISSRTDEQHCMAVSGTHLLNIKKRQLDAARIDLSMKVLVPDWSVPERFTDRVPHFRAHKGMHSLRCWGVDELGNDIDIDLWTALSMSYGFTHTMVFCGPPRYGKTPTALAVAAYLSHGCKQHHFVVGSSIDSLKDAAHLMAPGVAVVLDEYQATAPVGASNFITSVDDLKKWWACWTRRAPGSATATSTSTRSKPAW
jgi:hypothetical protein